MLECAGVACEARSSNVDEAAVKVRLREAEAVASELSAAKAMSIRSAGWVIGSDSVVSVEGRLFDKPRDREEAARHLRFFSEKTMLLTSGVALAHAGAIEWRHVETARLEVRPLSEEFIDSYLDAEWPEVGYTVGVFRLEARGVQLFSAIEGDHFTILGMPLIPLLAALRDRGLLLS